jgi:zinc D-Ala-D-Ala dipeptidase
MSGWYRDLDLLPDGIEQVIPANSPLQATVERVMNDTGLAQAPQPSCRAPK